MKLLSYASTRPGLQALGSIGVRLGTNSSFSHTEILFEHTDGVDDLMPDGVATSIDGAQWCASASAADKIPEWSPRRVGRTGGVRFKRIEVNPDHWIVQDLPAELFDARKVAAWFKENEGHSYDWRQIASFIGVIPNLVFNHSEKKFTCSEVAAEALGFPESYRYHPANLPIIIHRMNNGTLEQWADIKARAKEILRNSWK